MPHRVICPACGKHNFVDEGVNLPTIMCLACGAEVAMSEATPLANAPVAKKPAKPAKPAGAGWRLAVVALACLIVVGLVVALVMVPVRRTMEAADVRELLALKSEAEALAVAGKLEDAHAKYRELADRGVGYKVDDPIAWDLIDRAKSDQDRIFTLLLDKA